MTKFARGGYIAPHTSEPGTVRMMSVGQCAKGHTLWSIEGGRPEHFASADDLRAGDTSKLTCPNEVASDV